MSEKMFPLMKPHDRKKHEMWDILKAPRSVPWAFLAPHEEQAQRNHSQSLARLASRGGLDAGEILAIVTGKKWSEISKNYEYNIRTLMGLLDKYGETNATE
ncbi:MAG: hypothetical protein DRQ40_05320 [Gammaproteobacteria bacterium]|nr:MAG: hypothetical protein DRQ40_05320 [Gammaproteobacteria bacterium]